MRPIGLIPALVCLSGWAESGWAQQPPHLTVERAQGAEQCPDTESLNARIDQIRGRSSHEPAGSYRVDFLHREDVFSAVITTGPGGSKVRVLEHTGPTCTSLASATAVTLALLFDADATVKNGPEPIPAPSPIAVIDVPPVIERPPAERTATLSLGPVGLAGVLRPVSPALAGEVGVGGARWRTGIGVLWAIPQTLSLGPGTIDEKFVTGVARGCGAPVRSGALRLDICSGALLGLVTAEATSYTRNDRRARNWIAFPLEVAASWWAPPIGWELGVSGLVPVRRQDFSIDGLGVAYRSPPIAAMLSLRAVAILPW
jgi:hypothetical protein